MLKKPNQQASNTRKLVTPDEADRLASKLADKPYGDEERQDTATAIKQTRTSITLPASLLRLCEDTALTNKRSGREPKNVSAIVRAALELYFTGNK